MSTGIDQKEYICIRIFREDVNRIWQAVERLVDAPDQFGAYHVPVDRLRIFAEECANIGGLVM